MSAATLGVATLTTIGAGAAQAAPASDFTARPAADVKDFTGKDFTGKQEKVPALNPGEVGVLEFFRDRPSGQHDVTMRFVAPEHTTWAKGGYTWLNGNNTGWAKSCQLSDGNRVMTCESEATSGDLRHKIVASVKIDADAKRGTRLKGGQATATANGATSAPIDLAVDVKETEDVPLANPTIAAAGAAALAGGAFIVTRRRKAQLGN